MAMQQTDAEIASRAADALLFEQFRPAPLSWLLAWLFRPRHEPADHEPEQLDEHINGLA
ncbi:MAG: hypothetical protein JWM03_802 [Rhodocyclales bacterium]|nr:hypothetical protein [Rhodocyclales bacterium]MDB5887930.1 hypothetical protein [Rhodocyclales bacterium]